MKKGNLARLSISDINLTRSFLKKTIGSLFLILLFGLSNEIHAQNNGMSKNTTTINGKKYYIHKIAHAQSLFGIAKIYNVDVNDIIAENPSAKKGLIVGQELKIPFDKVKTGETKPVEAAKTPEVAPPAETKTVEPAPAATNTSQEVDLLNMVGDETPKKEKEIVSATFKSTRNINFHTTEVLPRRSLDFRISHRFQPLSGPNGTGYNAWGIDGPATLMLSLEYSYDGRCMIGVQRSFTADKTGDVFFKWKIFRQAKNGGSPVNVTYVGGGYNTFAKDPYLGSPNKFYNLNTDRLSFVNQLLISRKWAPWLSMQVGFAHVHYNLVGSANGFGQNDCMVGTGIIRLKYSKRQALILEYGYRVNTDYGYVDPVTKTPAKYFDSMGIGWEMETGGHVFQIFVTNSAGILENQYFMKTTEDMSTSGMRIGFNLMRVFSVGGKKGSW